MTIEEAIETIQYASAFNSENSPLTRALDMAFSALRSQQKAEKNEPLTLDELRDMDGEPVYAIWMKRDMGEWFIVDSYDNQIENPLRFILFDAITDGRCIVYRRPPEKEA